MVNILIGGDVCPIGRNKILFEQGDINKIYNDLLEEFKLSDLNIVNLECPLIDKDTPVKKSGPTLGAGSQSVHGLAKAGIDIVGLANNHIMDHGEKGLFNTIRVLKEADIQYVGAGKNIYEAKKILSRELNDVTVCIMAVAERECSISDRNKSGANPLDIIEFTKQIRDYRSKYDCIIILLHGGYQHYYYPSPNLQKISRFMIEEGAHAVICQHSHCPGSYEEYNGGLIVYGQGNFIFDVPNNPESWYQGFLVKLHVNRGARIKYKLIPFEQANDYPGVRKMNEEKGSLFIEALNKRSENLCKEDFIEQSWREFSKSKKRKYISRIRGHNRVARNLNEYFNYTGLFYNKEKLLALLNIIRCESHRELLETMLEHE